MTLTIWLAFFLACIVFSLSPGPGAIATLSCVSSHGARKAPWLILGLQTALTAHLIVVAVGLGALIASSDVAYQVMKYLGAGYLVYLGVDRWIGQQGGVDKPIAVGEGSPSRLVAQGILVNLFNPKSIVFLAAFLPQFINPAESLVAQYLVLGVTAISVDALIMVVYALAAGSISGLIASERREQLEQRVFGTLFIGLGLALASG